MHYIWHRFELTLPEGNGFYPFINIDFSNRRRSDKHALFQGASYRKIKIKKNGINFTCLRVDMEIIHSVAMGKTEEPQESTFFCLKNHGPESVICLSIDPKLGRKKVNSVGVDELLTF
jgi:hypothetical protein